MEGFFFHEKSLFLNGLFGVSRGPFFRKHPFAIFFVWGMLIRWMIIFFLDPGDFG